MDAETTRILMDIQRTSASTATNIQWLRQSFEEHKTTITKALTDHIEDDKRIMREHIAPLVKKAEQQKGADNQNEKTIKRFNMAYTILLPVVSLIAGIFGVKLGGH